MFTLPPFSISQPPVWYRAHFGSVETALICVNLARSTLAHFGGVVNLSSDRQSNTAEQGILIG
jgi:hypothetical protein